MRRKKTHSREGLAQSEVVGVILLFGITMTGIGIITVTGFPSLDSARDDVGFSRAQNEMMRLDSHATAVASGSGTKTVRLNLQEGSLNTVEKSTRVDINITNTTKNLNRSFDLNSVRYTMGDREVWFEAGGIFRKTSADANATMVSAPDFGFSRNSLTVSLVNVSTADLATAGGQQTFTVSRESKVDRPYRDTSPIRNGTVYVNVTTPNSEAWERYFENRHKQVVVVESNHDANPGWVKVRHVDVVSTTPIYFRQAILSSGKWLVLDNSTVDTVSGDNTADIEITEEIEFKKGSVVNGTVKSNLSSGSAAIDCLGSCGKDDMIRGDALARNTIEASHDSNDNSNIYVPPEYEINDSADVHVDVPEPVNDIINKKLGSYEGNTPLSDFATGGGDIDVPPGNYVVDGSNDIDWNSETINFNTDEGDINIAIQNGSNTKFSISKSEINVNGRGDVRIFRGCANGMTGFNLDGVEMNVRNNNSRHFQVYVYPDKQCSGTGPKLEIIDSTFYGAIYAPNNDRISLGQQNQGVEFYGAIIGERTELIDTELHYDRDNMVFPIRLRETDDPTRAHLHVTKSDVNVSG
ncbi:hypothetical protein ACEU6E_08870 [Halorutilales archaeon Cl-col2-1]